MAIELQFDVDALMATLARVAQRWVATSCSPEFGGLFIDHVDAGTPRFGPIEAGGRRLRLIFPFDLFIVSRAELSAAVGAVPAGALAPKGSLEVELVLNLIGAVIDGAFGDPDLAGLPLPKAQKAELSKRFAERLPGLPAPLFNATSLFDALRAPPPATSAFDLSPTTFAIRFDPTGPLVTRLAPGQAWCLFVDAPTTAATVRAQLPDDVLGISVAWHMSWTPVGGVPHVAIRAGITLPFWLQLLVGPGMVAAFSGNVRFDVAPAPDTVRNTVSWDIQLRGPTPILAAGLDTAEDFVRKEVRERLKARFAGAIPINSQSLFRDEVLPIPQLLGIRLLLDAIGADAAGMTLGGALSFISAAPGLVQCDVSPFGVPIVTGICIDEPKDRFLLSEVVFPAMVAFTSGGAFCSALCLGDAAVLQPFLETPDHGEAVDSGDVYFRVPGSLIAALTSDIEVILSTARGVRQFNLGRPEIEVDGDGAVTNLIDLRIRDCLQYYEPKGRIGFGGGPLIDIGRLKPRPPEEPDWMRAIGARHGIDVHLLSFQGLRPGELLEVRGDAGQHLVVSADRAGTARLPVFIPLGDVRGQASIVRASGLDFGAPPMGRTATFRRVSGLPAGDTNRIQADGDGRALVIRETSGRQTHNMFGRIGPQSLPLGDDIAALNPQPLPPGPPDLHAAMARELGLEGVLSVLPVPGFEEEPMALVQLQDGARLMIERDGTGAARVAGVAAGAVIEISRRADWALSRLGGRLQVFSVETSRPASLRPHLEAGAP